MVISFQDAHIACVAMPWSRRCNRLAHRTQFPQFRICICWPCDSFAQNARIAHHHRDHIAADVEQNERTQHDVEQVENRMCGHKFWQNNEQLKPIRYRYGNGKE